ncbi:MAG: DUF4290 domain-containing protein [Flavobacteriaceae bacterium]|nr:DUF4290 domain-containing protein [Flavobacteriaceae bacterium]
MEYVLENNSERENLHIPEYGRHIQKLVNHCKEIQDKDKRNKMAKAIVEVMGNLQPHLRDVPDFKHKLWDQLFIIAAFDLDVDSPYEILTKEEIQAKPEKLPYPSNPTKYRFYGNNIQIMINEAVTWEEGKMKDTLNYTIANHMKKCFLNWNKDTVEDAVIFKHLIDLSKGKIDLLNEGEVVLSPSSVLLKKKTPTKNKNKKHKKNNGRKKW